MNRGRASTEDILQARKPADQQASGEIPGSNLETPPEASDIAVGVHLPPGYKNGSYPHAKRGGTNLAPGLNGLQQTHSGARTIGPHGGAMLRAPENAPFIRGCTGKKRYAGKKEAMTKLNRIMRSHRRKRPEQLRAYHCDHCNGWHLHQR